MRLAPEHREAREKHIKPRRQKTRHINKCRAHGDNPEEKTQAPPRYAITH